MADITILKADGEKQLFKPEKLAESLRRAGADKELSDHIVEHVGKELVNGMSSTDIYQHAFSLLQKQKRHRSVAARYSLRRALVGFGPTGFPFEEYVAEIFKAQGYQAETDKILKGECVEHEIDVIAWSNKKLIMSEVKFHNELGLKSDLKVALYVKARIDDLKKVSFFHQGRQRKLDEGWLITNTKFSEKALEYGECVGLNMIGWNYPSSAKGSSLQDLIEQYKLHPVSCLTTLTVGQKQELFMQKIVLCRSLVDDPNILPSLGLNAAKIEAVKEEVNSLNVVGE